MKAMEELKELLEEELKKIAKKGDITPTELESVYKAVDVIKDIATIKAMEESSSDETSEQYMRRSGYSQDDGQSGRMMWYPYMDSPVWNQNRSMNSMAGNQGGSYRGDSYDGHGMSNDGSYRGSYEGGSNDGGSYNAYDGASNARRGRDGDGDGQYSERRGRDRMGRFTSRDGGSYESSNGSYAYRGYSRHTAKERMMGKLESMLEDAQTEKERMAIRQCLEELEG